MKKFFLLYLTLSVFSTILIYSQSYDVITKTPLEKGFTGDAGPQCVGGIVYDDNTFENGYGAGTGTVVKYVMKMTPGGYPYVMNQICLALTRTSAGNPNWAFDLVVYDTTGTGGSPGNIVATIANQTAVNVPVWPTVTWYDFTGISNIPALSGGSYYVGLSWDATTMPSHYIGADESPTTPAKPCYRYMSGAWTPVASKVLGIRIDGLILNYTHDISVGPFLSFPTTFVVGQTKNIKARVQNVGTSNEPSIPIKFSINGLQISTTTINLNSAATDSVNFSWMPADPGNYTLKIISALATDQYRQNDTITANIYVYPSGVPLTCIGSGITPVGYPFYTYYMDSRTDMLYLSSELGTGGIPCSILMVGFNVVTAAPQVMNGFKIKMANTIQSSLSGYATVSWTDVYSGNYSIPAPGWQYFSLSTPFQYNGSNLLMEICFNNSSYTTNSTVMSTALTSRVFHGHADLPSSDGCTGITTGAVQATLPNMCMLTNFTGINNNQNGIPSEFSLEQNYPNPFNPVTSIKYSIPKTSDVKLVIYDALGREVTSVLNEKLSPGTYEFSWNASSYSSGLYFYKIECEGFSDVKKMVLIK